MAIVREKDRDFWDRYTDAVQFDGSEASADRLCSGVDRIPGLIPDPGLKWSGRLLLKCGASDFWIVNPGDWMVLGGDGEYHPCKNEAFRLKYEEVA